MGAKLRRCLECQSIGREAGWDGAVNLEQRRVGLGDPWVFWDLRIVLLTLAVVIGGVVSHMPGQWRYHAFVHGRAVGTRGKG